MSTWLKQRFVGGRSNCDWEVPVMSVARGFSIAALSDADGWTRTVNEGQRIVMDWGLEHPFIIRGDSKESLNKHPLVSDAGDAEEITQ